MAILVDATDTNIYRPTITFFLIKLNNQAKRKPIRIDISTTKILKSYTGILKDNESSLFFWLNTMRVKIIIPANFPELAPCPPPPGKRSGFGSIVSITLLHRVEGKHSFCPEITHFSLSFLMFKLKRSLSVQEIFL
jgi:hypothetical protein